MFSVPPSIKSGIQSGTKYVTQDLKEISNSIMTLNKFELTLPTTIYLQSQLTFVQSFDVAHYYTY